MAITAAKWQLGCGGVIVQSCFYKVGQKHMTCMADSQRSAIEPVNNTAAVLSNAPAHIQPRSRSLVRSSRTSTSGASGQKMEHGSLQPLVSS